MNALRARFIITSVPFASLALIALAALLPSGSVRAQSADTTWPRPLATGISIRPYLKTEGGPVRIAKEPHTGRLVYATGNGNIYRILPGVDSARGELLYTLDDHGMSSITGMAFGPDGTIYLVGNLNVGPMNVATIRRGRLQQGDSTKRSWANVAQTIPYPRSNTNYDHTFSGIVVSPDGKSLFVNSGSRSDHGELQTNGDNFPGMREIPITSAIFRLPADSTDLLLMNDESQLRSRGFLYVDGTRNTFDLAFAPNGDLFGADNSGDRDDSEELNWLREGHHYGFPWRMGTNFTPQQFPGYDPASDLLVNKESYGSKGGFYYNDPTYPAQPAGITFTDPIMNLGPDAIKYRDAISGAITTSSEQYKLGTFTAHRSPLGLVFDLAGAMPSGYTGHAFITSWTNGRPGGSELLTPFDEPGQDLLHLDLMKSDTSYVVRTTRIAEGFNEPIDAAIDGNRIYILEYGGRQLIWEVTISSPVSVEHAASEAESLPFPNPIGERAELTIDIPEAGHLSVELYDMLGRPARGIFDGSVAAGPRRFVIDASGLASGAYTVRVSGAGVERSMQVRVVGEGKR